MPNSFCSKWYIVVCLYVLAAVPFMQAQVMHSGYCARYQGATNFNKTYVAEMVMEPGGYLMMMSNAQEAVANCNLFQFHINGSFVYSYDSAAGRVTHTAQFSAKNFSFSEPGYIDLRMPRSEYLHVLVPASKISTTSAVDLQLALANQRVPYVHLLNDSPGYCQKRYATQSITTKEKVQKILNTLGVRQANATKSDRIAQNSTHSERKGQSNSTAQDYSLRLSNSTIFSHHKLDGDIKLDSEVLDEKYMNILMKNIYNAAQANLTAALMDLNKISAPISENLADADEIIIEIIVNDDISMPDESITNASGGDSNSHYVIFLRDFLMKVPVKVT